MSDYIIVGAGSAGCVMAARLSEDPRCRVTLIEAGGADSHLFYRMPAGYIRLMTSGMGNWNYETVPQEGLGGRRMYFPRGKVIGGSSSINGQVWLRGNPGDYDGWAAAGNPGWSYRDCLPYFRAVEHVPGGDPTYRGQHGPIGLSALTVDQMAPIAKAFVAAGIAAGYPYNADMHGASQEGFGPAAANFANGRRQSASWSYLRPALSRPNLTVLQETLVSRILLRHGRAVGVEILHRGRQKQLMTDGEVILCGGAINSPQLLELSGIGDARLLSAAGVKVAHDLPGVGENLQDHLSVTLKQETRLPVSALDKLKPMSALKTLLTYIFTGGGPALTNGLQCMAFVKSSPQEVEPDLQYHVPMLMYEDHGRKVIPRHGFMLMVNVARPQSLGSVHLASADPTRSPRIDPRYLSHPDDLRRTREGLRIARELVTQSSFEKMRGTECAPGATCHSDADLNAYIRATGQTVYHPVGTCKMGADDMAVVDHQLRVRGIDALRIVDASVMPRIVSANTNFPTMMIAERAAAFITAPVGSHGTAMDAEAADIAVHAN